MKFSLTWLRITIGKQVVTKEQWDTVLTAMTKELQHPDYNDDGSISVGELIRFVGSVVIIALKSLKQVP